MTGHLHVHTTLEEGKGESGMYRARARTAEVAAPLHGPTQGDTIQSNSNAGTSSYQIRTRSVYGLPTT